MEKVFKLDAYFFLYCIFNNNKKKKHSQVNHRHSDLKLYLNTKCDLCYYYILLISQVKIIWLSQLKKTKHLSNSRIQPCWILAQLDRLLHTEGCTVFGRRAKSRNSDTLSLCVGTCRNENKAIDSDGMWTLLVVVKCFTRSQLHGCCWKPSPLRLLIIFKQHFSWGCSRSLPDFTSHFIFMCQLNTKRHKDFLNHHAD